MKVFLFGAAIWAGGVVTAAEWLFWQHPEIERTPLAIHAALADGTALACMLALTWLYSRIRRLEQAGARK